MEDQQLRRSGSQIRTLPIFPEHWRAKENGEVSEVAAIKNHLSHTSLPQAKQKKLPGSKGSLGAEVRRGSRREDTLEFLQFGRRYPNFSGILKQKTSGQSGWRWAGTHCRDSRTQRACSVVQKQIYFYPLVRQDKGLA